MARALVLNASYEPLGDGRRPGGRCVLVLGHKADCVHPTGLVLHAEHVEVPVPSVVRLRQFVHVPYRRRVAVSRRAVMARDGHRCQYCGAHADSIDHVVPRSRGGTAHVGQRRGRVPALQRPQARPHAEGLGHAPPARARRAQRRGLVDRRRRRGARGLAHLPRRARAPAGPRRRRLTELGRSSHATGSAAGVPRAGLLDPVVRAVHVWEVDRPALVLGSAQPDDVVDHAACARGRRRGGAPPLRRRRRAARTRAAPCGSTSSCRGPTPLGRRRRAGGVVAGGALGAALAALGVAGPAVHRGGLVRHPVVDLVCFAGLGPGEVTAGAGGRRSLGISQRRTRAGARFQCAVPLTWDSATLAAVLPGAVGLAVPVPSSRRRRRPRRRLLAELAVATGPIGRTTRRFGVGLSRTAVRIKAHRDGRERH